MQSKGALKRLLSTTIILILLSTTPVSSYAAQSGNEGSQQASVSTLSSRHGESAKTSTFPPLIHDLGEPPLVFAPSADDPAQKPSTLHPAIHEVTPTTEFWKKTPVADEVPKLSTSPPLIHTLEGDKNDKTSGMARNRCPWAIVGCCPANSSRKQPLGDCLEYLGCPGPFWEPNPCADVFVKEAIQQIYEHHKNGRF